MPTLPPPTHPDLARFDDLAEAKNLLLTTYRRDGTPVATPVWFVVVDGVIHATTDAASGKVKRIRRDGRVTVAACTVRGKATGPAVAAHARLLDEATTRQAVKLVDRRYVWGRFMHRLERVLHHATFVGVAIEPAAGAEPGAGAVTGDAVR